MRIVDFLKIFPISNATIRRPKHFEDLRKLELSESFLIKRSLLRGTIDAVKFNSPIVLFN